MTRPASDCAGSDTEADTGPARPGERELVAEAAGRPDERRTGAGRASRLVRRALSDLFEESPIGIAVLDPAGCVLAANQALAELLARDRPGLIGQPLALAFAGEDRDDVQARLAQLVMRTTPRVTLDSVRVAIAGPGVDPGDRAVTLFAAPVEEQGAVAALRVHLLDATERYELEARFVHAQRLHALGQFAGGIAHDFNNLIGGVLGYCELLLGRVGPADPGHEDLSQIRGYALRARELARQLLAFARKQPLRPVRLQVDTAIEALLPMLRGLAGAAVPIGLRIDHPLPRVRIDASRFDQVIVNLVVNARDAMPAGGEVTLRLAQVDVPEQRYCRGESMPAGSYVMIEVADTGCGIPREVIGHIFEPFFTTKADGDGNGLGLATVWGIVQQSGGLIDVESVDGGGTTFRIYLPADTPPARAQADDTTADQAVADCAAGECAAGAPPPGAGAASGGARTVLLVDDEEPIRRFVARALRARGFCVLEAEDGDAALDLLAAQPALDLVIADVALPGMDGRMVAAGALDRFPHARAIIMSGHLLQERCAIGAGETRMVALAKPFTLAELAAAVEQTMAG